MEIRMLEILIFAFLTGYLLFRLWSILGTRGGFEAPPPNTQPEESQDKVISLPTKQLKTLSQEEISPSQPLNVSVEEGLRQIQKADPAFQIDPFLDGAITAYEMIVEAFSSGDKETLKPLLSPAVFKSFSHAIKEREEANQTVETKIVELKDPEVVSIEVKGKKEQISIKFVSEQIIITKDETGQIQDNPAHLTQTIKDIWTFSRQIGSKDPNWILISTRVESN